MLPGRFELVVDCGLFRIHQRNEKKAIGITEQAHILRRHSGQRAWDTSPYSKHQLGTSHSLQPFITLQPFPGTQRSQRCYQTFIGLDGRKAALAKWWSGEYILLGCVPKLSNRIMTFNDQASMQSTWHCYHHGTGKYQATSVLGDLMQKLLLRIKNRKHHVNIQTTSDLRRFQNDHVLGLQLDFAQLLQLFGLSCNSRIAAFLRLTSCS